jgi:metallophosphoesterase
MDLLKERKLKRRIGRKTKVIYYILDTHFRNQDIFDKCKRPFKSLDEMESTVISKWNNKVNDVDVVYVLGDVAKDDDVSAIQIFNKLKGHKHLIVGNHDHLILEEIRKLKIFESVKLIDLIMDKDRKVCICHYPLMDWMEFNREGILVYGHIHNKTSKNGYAYKMMKDYYANLPAYNCGVDVCEFEPRTLDELIHLKEVNKDEPYIN